MTKTYRILRWAGYICGIAGLALALAGRRMGSALQAAGFILLAVMFLCFFVAQVLFIFRRLNSKKGAESPPAS